MQCVFHQEVAAHHIIAALLVVVLVGYIVYHQPQLVLVFAYAGGPVQHHERWVADIGIRTSAIAIVGTEVIRPVGIIATAYVTA